VAKANATMRRRASPMRWRQYLCSAGSAHNSVEAASIAAAMTVASIAAAMTVASIGPSRSAKAATVRCHCDCAGPNVMRIVSSRSNRMARQFHAILSDMTGILRLQGWCSGRITRSGAFRQR